MWPSSMQLVSFPGLSFNLQTDTDLVRDTLLECFLIPYRKSKKEGFHFPRKLSVCCIITESINLFFSLFIHLLHVCWVPHLCQVQCWGLSHILFHLEVLYFHMQAKKLRLKEINLLVDKWGLIMNPGLCTPSPLQVLQMKINIVTDCCGSRGVGEVKAVRGPGSLRGICR